jgi:hypothetical protein
VNFTRITITLASAAAVLLLAGWALARLARWRQESPEELERLRRLDVNRRGRIAAARIVDFIEPEGPRPGARLIVYKYELAGVTYEAAQDISALPGLLSLARHATDQVASVKYDPKVPTNSIIACEDWCGVRKPMATPGSRSTESPARAFEQS